VTISQLEVTASRYDVNPSEPHHLLRMDPSAVTDVMGSTLAAAIGRPF